MGLEKHVTALFLKLRSEGVSFGRLLTLGHQNVCLEHREYCRVLEKLGQSRNDSVPLFADGLLRILGASEVEAMDFSPYEGAQIVHDLNQPIPTEWHQRYDTIFDGGTLEHVFDFPTAIRNCMQMLKPGGRFISVTIPNNWCGHGFYQFSPELFYRVFAPANGFSVVEMYIAEEHGRTYAVKDPAVVKSRVQLCNCTPVYLLVHTRRDAVCEIFAQRPQQSDYVVTWSGESKGRPPRPNRWKRFPLKYFGGLQGYVGSVKKTLALKRYYRDCSLANRKIYTPVDLRI